MPFYHGEGIRLYSFGRFLRAGLSARVSFSVDFTDFNAVLDYNVMERNVRADGCFGVGGCSDK